MRYLIALSVLLVAKLSLSQNTFPANGNVGIGTPSPQWSLDVFGFGQRIMNTGSTGYTTLRLYNDQNSAYRALEIDYSGSAYPATITNGSPIGEGASITTTGAFPLSLGTSNAARVTIAAGGNVGIGIPAPQEALHINGNIRGNINGALRINSGNGYIDVGAQNSGWAHIYTDRPNFIFNQGVYSIPGVFSSYSNADLTLATGSTNRLSISNATGNVGIGTINAPEKLTVTGNIQVPLSNAMGYLVSTDKLTHNGNSVGNYSLGWFWDSWQTGAPTGYLSSAGGLKFFTGSTLRMAIDAFGNMGIGTGSAVLDAKLDVKGQVHAQEVKVDLSVPGPDYVFEKEYQLTSLEEIKNYIDQNKHLPEVPSAQEMEKNGVLLGEMNMLLLRKIEELTLHLIEQNKIIAELKERSVSPDPSGKKIEELTLYVIELKKEVQDLKENQQPKK